MKRDLDKLRVLVWRKSRGIKAPASDTRLYYSALERHTKAVAAVFEATVIKPLSARIVNDSLGDDVRKAFNTFDRRVASLPSALKAATMFRSIAQHIDEYHKRKFVAAAKKAISVDISSTLKTAKVNYAVRRAIRDNVKLIKSIEKSYKRRAQHIISDTLLKGGDSASMKKALYELGGFSQRYNGTEIRRAKIIARDQTQKLVQAIDRARQDDAGITHYFWDAVIDERTDEDHKANDGKRFAWARPPKTGHPGERPLCRCVARPDYSTMEEREAA